MWPYRRGFGFKNRFTDYLYTRLGTAIITANLQNSQVTTAPASPFPACWVFTSRFVATASNNGDSSASRAQVLSSQTPVQNWLDRPNFLPYKSSGRTEYKTPFPTVPLLLRFDSLSWERVQRAVAQKRSWYISPSRGCRIVPALHATICFLLFLLSLPIFVLFTFPLSSFSLFSSTTLTSFYFRHFIPHLSNLILFYVDPSILPSLGRTETSLGPLLLLLRKPVRLFPWNNSRTVERFLMISDSWR
jgi:hypothetical protein